MSKSELLKVLNDQKSEDLLVLVQDSVSDDQLVIMHLYTNVYCLSINLSSKLQRFKSIEYFMQ